MNIIEKRNFDISYDKTKWTDLEKTSYAFLSEKKDTHFLITSFRFLDNSLVAKAHIKGFLNQEYYLIWENFNDVANAIDFLENQPLIKQITPVDFCEPDFDTQYWFELEQSTHFQPEGNYIPSLKSRDKIKLLATNYTFLNGKLFVKGHLTDHPEAIYISKWYTEQFDKDSIVEFLNSFPNPNTHHPIKFSFKI